MSADPYKVHLEAYVLGLLDEPEARMLKQHLKTCADCKAQWAVLSQAAEHLDHGFDQAPPPYLRARVLARLKNAKPAKPAWLMWGVPGLVAAAALVLMVKIAPERAAQKQALDAAPQAQAELAQVLKAPQAPLLSQPGAAGEAAKPAQGQNQAADSQAKAPEADKAAPQEKTERWENARPSASEDEVPPAAPAAYAPAEAKKDLAASGSPAGGSAAKESAPAEAQAVGRSELQDVMSYRAAKKAKMHAALPSPAIVLALSEIQGPLDTTQVKAGIGGLARRVQERIASQGEVRVAVLRVALSPAGKVVTAAFSGPAFTSGALNQFILAQVQATDFGAPLSPAPATFTIQITVR
jgi:hypothetical protein